MFSLQPCTLMSLLNSKTSRLPLAPWIALILVCFFKDPKLQRSLRSVVLVFVYIQPRPTVAMPHSSQMLVTAL